MGFAAAPVARTQAGTGQTGAVVLLVAAALTVVVACRSSNSAPRITLTGTDGSIDGLSRPRGFTVLLFWSRESPPSLSMLAELSRLSDGADTARLRCVAVSIDEAGGRLPPGLSGRLLNLHDQGRATSRKLGVSVLPTVVVLDSSLRTLARVQGHGVTALQELEEILVRLE